MTSRSDSEGLCETTLPAEETTDGRADVLQQQIGPFRLVSQIGRGGMGSVFRAVREGDHFQQVVALKVLHRIDSDEYIQRFHIERRILARLKHPRIAHLVDGGTTEDGRPWFAMELVEGLPIDRWCDQHQADVRQRIELFLQICDVLHFAHRNLVVHRDLKPANILVQEDGGLKLLDFGIAKLIEEDLDPDDSATIGGMSPMTMSYAAPEQILGQDITTATDIYALGVVLYQLLTGRLPSRVSEEKMTPIMAICHLEPQRPSSVLAEPIPARRDRKEISPEEIARRRKTTLPRLRSKIEGDLDSIVLHALQKETPQRYASAERMAEDLERFLQGRPVQAREGTWFYVACKWIARHRKIFAASTLACTLILGLSITATWMWHQAENERLRTEQTVELLVEIFEQADPDETNGRELTAREMLERGFAKLDDRLAEDPEIYHRLALRVSRLYGNLGEAEKGIPLMERSVELLRGREPDETFAEALKLLGRLYSNRNAPGDDQTAAKLFRETLSIHRKLHGEQDRDLGALGALSNLAVLEYRQGDLHSAEKTFRELLTIRREMREDPLEISRTLHNLGAVLKDLGALEEAETTLREALHLRREHSEDPRHTRIASTLKKLGETLRDAGRPEEARVVWREALEIYLERRGDGHSSVADVRTLLANLPKP